MSANIGLTSLLFVILLSATSIFLSFSKVKIAKISTQEINIYLFTVIFAFAVLSQISLINAYVISDFSLKNVFENSHTLKPLIYKISGSWGNHEGSMLLLVTILAGYSFLFALFDKSEYKSKTLGFQALIILGFASFTAFVSSPFEKLFPVPDQGMDLNPLLQDVGLALHPPVLYIGYLGFSLVFSLTLAGLLHGKIDKYLAKSMTIWLYASYSTLTLGVILGSWWAYRELGWGGYWFWDPVENVSLMPWLAATSLLHCIKLLKKDDSFKIWTALLAIINFILCLFGIFLVRSGLLTSVHSFAVDASRGFYIICLILLIGGVAFTIFAAKINDVLRNVKVKGREFIFSKANLVNLNNYILLIALFTILVGVFYPIISLNIFDSAISVGENYYNKVFGYLLLPFLIFLNFLYYKGDNFSKMIRSFNKDKKNYFAASFALVLSYLVAEDFNDNNILAVILLFFCFNIAIITALRKKSPTNLAHFGFVIAITGIIISTMLGAEKELNIKVGETVKFDNQSSFEITLDGIDYNQGKNFFGRIAKFSVKKDGVDYTKLEPEFRYYPAAKTTTFEADIYYSLEGDFYLAVGNRDDNDNYALRIYHKPYLYFLWLGVGFIILAGVVKIFRIVK